MSPAIMLAKSLVLNVAIFRQFFFPIVRKKFNKYYIYCVYALRNIIFSFFVETPKITVLEIWTVRQIITLNYTDLMTFPNIL